MMNVINFSGGRTSAYMTKRLIDEGGEYLVTFQNTGKEMPQTLDFVNECDKQWGLNVVWLEYRKPASFEVVTYETASRNGEPFNQLLQQRPSAIPNQQFRYCTLEMKINTLKRYLKSIGVDNYISYNGIRYDEPRRWAKVDAIDVDVELPLVKWKTTKLDVLNWWEKQSFDLKVNEPYGNCDGCFLKGKGKLSIIAKEKPELFDWWINVEKESGHQFKKEITYQQIKDKSQSQLGLWDNDPSFECFCNVD
jgi:3'-phosphoadenosine 5'-phosphosulfate sulfotransferase (PAPS reductase)/FAD synthetase